MLCFLGCPQEVLRLITKDLADAKMQVSSFISLVSHRIFSSFGNSGLRFLCFASDLVVYKNWLATTN